MNQTISSSVNRQFSLCLPLLAHRFFPSFFIFILFFFVRAIIILNFETKWLLCDFHLFCCARIQKCIWWLDNSFPVNKYTSALILIVSLSFSSSLNGTLPYIGNERNAMFACELNHIFILWHLSIKVKEAHSNCMFSVWTTF